MSFVMLVKEIFNFQDGRIVFVGDIYNGPSLIKDCNCDIYVGSKFFSKVHIEGEMIVKGNKTSFRSLSSTDKINPVDIPYRNLNVRLVCNE